METGWKGKLPAWKEPEESAIVNRMPQVADVQGRLSRLDAASDVNIQEEAQRLLREVQVVG